MKFGCYKDTAVRAIPTMEGLDPLLDGAYPTRVNPINKCAEVALKRGYKMFAVQNGGWCAGSTTGHLTYNTYGPSSDCLPDGEGGPWANQVYILQGLKHFKKNI